MKTPVFWYKKKSFLSLILFPLSILWLFIVFLKNKFNKIEYFNIPIICVGNAIAGGGGKTPLIIALCKQYHNKKISVHVVYKEYKVKKANKVVKVLPTHKSEDIGDEPILISQHATTWVCKNRKDGIIAAINDHADLVLLDDGLQDTKIFKDLNILVANQNQGNGNNMVIPAGPLRERMSISLSRSDCIFFYGKITAAKTLFYSYKNKIFTGNIITNMKLLVSMRKKNIVAFAGIAHPDNFFNLLYKKKLNLVKKIYFSDHHIYSRKDIINIIDLSKNKNAKILTTSKDYTKIPDDLKRYITVIEITVNFEKKLFLNFLNNKIRLNV